MKPIQQLALVLAISATVLSVESAQAQKGTGLDLPDRSELPRPVEHQEYDYEVEFAGPPQMGYMVINDRGVERGPYGSWDEAHEVGMQTPWVYFWIEEIEYQTWYHWETYDEYWEAVDQMTWLRDLGFWARINQIPVISFGEIRKSSTLPLIGF